MAQATQIRISASEFAQLAETTTPTQLIDGELIVSPAPELRHQDFVFALAKLIEALAPGGRVRISPVDVHLDESNVVQPDVLWTAPDSQCVSVEGKYLRGAPDLVVEVLSPGTARYDKVEKFRLYEKHGTHEYWVVDPIAEYVEVWQLVQDKYERFGVFGPQETFESEVLAGKGIDLKQAFAA